MSNLDKERKEYIEAAIPFICQAGWSEEALKSASKKHFGEELYYKTLFDSLKDVVDNFEHIQDKKMLQKFGNKKKEDSIRAFIANMILYRIKELEPDMHKAMKDYYISLKHAPEAPRAIWNTSDIIWRAAGDTSTDMNYYSKRFLLSSIYTMSLNHYAKNHESIDEYVKDSLDNLVKRMQKLKIPKIEDIPILRLFS